MSTPRLNRAQGLQHPMYGILYTYEECDNNTDSFITLAVRRRSNKSYWYQKKNKKNDSEWSSGRWFFTNILKIERNKNVSFYRIIYLVVRVKMAR